MVSQHNARSRIKPLVLLYITTSNEDEAKKISLHLLKKKFIACANLFPIKSMYWWEGKVTNGEEVVLILKTLEKKCTQVTAEIKKIHSYNVPCILTIKAEGNEEYVKWVEKEIR